MAPTVTLYELGLEGMADQNGELEELEPMVSVVVAAASVPADESSDTVVMVTFCPI